ncbi:M10 family metallopeptidase C-terminal domain-containing protein [Stagnihabitans tardus]|uniref:C-type lectin domain-containing protein n=1 Tax=Stagnihabitans tardus TaxID=2699202 RepID=A0AAE4Y6I4_9RHOB|nr:M10 family metallopeptidase C-terminal domain-containing protein [Stagnihabitans tardus]NBZ86012.1 hypothetical protein [Stagnihabitans tardus]
MYLTMVREADKIFVNVQYDDNLTWNQANALGVARGPGWLLACIQNQAEQDAVMTVLSGKAWIGLYQEGAGVEEPGGGWAWVDGTWVSDYQNWYTGEPNNFGIEDNGEIYTNGHWNDIPDNVATNSVAVYQVSALTGFTLTGGYGTDRLLGGDGADTIFARAGNDVILSGDGDDQVSGGSGNNQIEGGLGRDTISSGGGSDTITGGAGADLLMAGSGADVFVYEAASDSTRAAQDRIRYFNDAADVIDFTALSDRLHISDTMGFHGEAGEIVLRQQAKKLFVLLDIDGNGQADLTLQLGGTHHLTAANFLIDLLSQS